MKNNINKRILTIASAIIIVALIAITIVICIRPDGKASDSGNNDVSINQEIGSDDAKDPSGSGVEPIGKEENLLDEEDLNVTVTPIEPSANKTTASEAIKKGKRLGYASYVSMSAEDQYKFYQSFKNSDDFLDWYNKAKKKYEKKHKVTEINPGDVIDLE